MIPYFDPPVLRIGPFTISLFSTLVLLAVIVGMVVVRRFTARNGLDTAIAERLVWWTLVGGFLGAHLVDRLAYFPRETLRDPLSLLQMWNGISAYGGFLGGIAGIALLLRRVSLRPHTWRYIDSIAYAFPFAWVVGRLGCFVASDHPGTPTGFFLGQTYRDGVVRHNLGLEEAIFTALVVGLFVLLGRRQRSPGFFTGLLAVLYAPGRFLLDILRIGDARYLGLTPAQWAAIPLLLAGLAILRHARAAADETSSGV